MSQEIAATSPIATQQIALPRDIASQDSKKNIPSSPSTDTQQAKAIAVDTVVINATKVVQGDRLQRIEGSMTKNTTLATSIRQADSALDAVSSHVQAMKANLAKIVKNYPPFSIDSKERIELLRSFISLRKEIDSMTIPPPPPQSGVQLKSEIWQAKGVAGLLPGELATNAPDAQIHSAHDQLGSAVQVISEGRQELRQNVLAKG